MNRRELLLAAVGMGIATAVPAQTQPVRIVVGFSAGGPVDFVARTLADQLRKELGRSVIVENKPGANGAIGAVEVKRAKPDGSTLWLTSVGAAAINQSLYPSLPYEMLVDFAPVSLVSNNVELLVATPSLPVADAAEFVSWGKKQGAPVTMASSGTGSIPHLALEQLREASGVDFIHVPYKGAAPAITDVMGGQVSAVFLDVPAVMAHVKSGRLKALGIASKFRHPGLPDVKTFEEQGLAGVDTNNWYGLYTAAKVAENVIDELNKAVRQALADPETLEKLKASGTEPQASSPRELAELTRNDTEKWARLIKAKGIKAE